MAVAARQSFNFSLINHRDFSVLLHCGAILSEILGFAFKSSFYGCDNRTVKNINSTFKTFDIVCLPFTLIYAPLAQFAVAQFHSKSSAVLYSKLVNINVFHY